MKKCSKCGVVKSEESFGKKGNGLRAHCKECQRKMWLSWYSNPENRRNHLERNAGLTKEARASLVREIREAKNKACADCGNEYPHYVMDFDHVRGQKVLAVSKLAAMGCARRVREEIAKCEVVCANCHRIRTHERG